jgi:methylated-DNA-[protein]-cysteine S-methyltransferase
VALRPSTAGFVVRCANPCGARALEEQVLEWLHAYASGREPEGAVPLALPSAFRGAALAALRRVPFGSTITYRELAQAAGAPRAARAAGSACRANPFPLLVPCHRVVRSCGALGGFAYGLPLKRLLLDFEQ